MIQIGQVDLAFIAPTIKLSILRLICTMSAIMRLAIKKCRLRWSRPKVPRKVQSILTAIHKRQVSQPKLAGGRSAQVPKVQFQRRMKIVRLHLRLNLPRTECKLLHSL